MNHNTTYDTLKRINILMLGLVCSIVFVFASSNYKFQSLLFDFGGKDSTFINNGSGSGNQFGPYGMVIDREGKMWFGFYSGYSNEVYRNATDKIRLTGLRCVLPDSTEASFSPIELIEFPDNSRDTLYIGNPDNGYCRGISIASDGNILYTAGPTLYKLDYTDGSGIAKFNSGMIDKPIRTHIAAVQDCSYVYFAPYPQYEQLDILDENLGFVTAGLTLTQSIQNAIAVRTKANGDVQLFSATNLDGIGIFVYESQDPTSQQFALVDTIGNFTEETDTNVISYYAWANFMEWIDKEEGIMIFGNDQRAFTTVTSGNPPDNYLAARWVVIDVDTDDILYWLGSPWYEVIGGEAYPKSVSPDVPEQYLENDAMCMTPTGAIPLGGSTPTGFYLTDRNLNCIQHVEIETGIDHDEFIPYGLTLEQNYPNPFNPMAIVSFTLRTADNISLDIYDLKGRLIMSIFKGYLDEGEHKVNIDASALPSGTYIYTLHTNELNVSRKMTLLK